MRFVSDFQLNKTQFSFYFFIFPVMSENFCSNFLFFQVFSQYLLIYQFQIQFILLKSKFLQQFMVLFDFLERDCSKVHLLVSLLDSNRLDTDLGCRVVCYGKFSSLWKFIDFDLKYWAYPLGPTSPFLPGSPFKPELLIFLEFA